jgi:hypothetical protein
MLGQDLDSDRAVQPRVLGTVDLAHATGAKRGEYLEGAETCPNSEWHSS